MSIKCEPRGKYSGAKIHLNAEQCVLYMDLVKTPTPEKFLKIQEMALKIGKKLIELEKEFPNLLKDRTQEEIKAELENEFESAKAKLEAMGKGNDWKQVKVEKPKVEPWKPKASW